MSFSTLELTSQSNKGWKRPLRTERHSYGSSRGVADRISRLVRLYGRDNVLQKAKVGDPNTVVVYIRLY